MGAIFIQIRLYRFVIRQCQIVPTGMHLKYTETVFEVSEIEDADRIDGVCI